MNQILSRLLLPAGILLSLLLMLCGCAQPMVAQGVPDDFSLDVAILPEAGNTAAAQHFILHPDGSLQAGSGAQGAFNHYPGQARQLSTDQMAELLTLARQAMASSTNSTVPTQWLHEKPPESGPAMLLWLRDAGHESATRFDSTNEALPPAAQRIKQRLKELALIR